MFIDSPLRPESTTGSYSAITACPTSSTRCRPCASRSTAPRAQLSSTAATSGRRSTARCSSPAAIGLAVTFDDGERERARACVSRAWRSSACREPSSSPWGQSARRELLGWDELAALRGRGVGDRLALGHSRAPDRARRRRARRGAARARARRSRTRWSRPCRSIAYPYGESDERVRAAAARAGYTAGCTTGGTLRRRRARLAARRRRRQRRQRPLQAEDEQARPLAPRHPAAPTRSTGRAA